jgi:hypothetical protein
LYLFVLSTFCHLKNITSWYFIVDLVKWNCSLVKKNGQQHYFVKSTIYW